MRCQYKREPLTTDEATRLLGHDSLLTTEIYLNLSPEHVVEEFQQKW